MKSIGFIIEFSLPLLYGNRKCILYFSHSDDENRKYCYRLATVKDSNWPIFELFYCFPPAVQR